MWWEIGRKRERGRKRGGALTYRLRCKSKEWGNARRWTNRQQIRWRTIRSRLFSPKSLCPWCPTPWWIRHWADLFCHALPALDSTPTNDRSDAEIHACARARRRRRRRLESSYVPFFSLKYSQILTTEIRKKREKRRGGKALVLAFGKTTYPILIPLVGVLPSWFQLC